MTSRWRLRDRSISAKVGLSVCAMARRLVDAAAHVRAVSTTIDAGQPGKIAHDGLDVVLEQGRHGTWKWQCRYQGSGGNSLPCAPPPGKKQKSKSRLRGPCFEEWMLRQADITCPCPCRPCHPCRRHAAAGGFVLRQLRQTMASVVSISDGDRRCVLQRRAGHLGRIQDAHFDHVAVGAVGGVVAVVALAGQHRVHDHARLRRRRCARSCAAAASMARSTSLMPASWSGLSPLIVASSLAGAQQRDAAAGHDAFFHGSAGGVQRVFDAGLLFLHLDFGGGADLDHCNAAGQLGHALLQLFTVVVARSLLRSARAPA